jgi:hypothetical protein
MIQLSKTPTEWILVRSGSTDEHNTFTRYAVLRLTKELADEIKKVRDMRKMIKLRLSSIYQISLWCDEAWFISSDNGDEDGAGITQLEEEEKISAWGQGDYWWYIKPLTDDQLNSLIVERIESGCLKVSDDGFIFDGIVKHTDTTVWTQRLKFDLLK